MSKFGEQLRLESAECVPLSAEIGLRLTNGSNSGQQVLREQTGRLAVDAFGTLFEAPFRPLPRVRICRNNRPRTISRVLFGAMEHHPQNVSWAVFGHAPGVQCLTIRGIASRRNLARRGHFFLRPTSTELQLFLGQILPSCAGIAPTLLALGLRVANVGPNVAKFNQVRTSEIVAPNSASLGRYRPKLAQHFVDVGGGHLHASGPKRHGRL